MSVVFEFADVSDAGTTGLELAKVRNENNASITNERPIGLFK